MSVYRSLFDIIGPVMVGPSSSHTAGAVRIGLVARSIFGCTPEEAKITFYESFAHTYQGHGTDLALISGLLGLPSSSEKIRHAYELAEKANMKVTIETSDEAAEHPNQADIELKSSDHELSVRGVSLGGGIIDIRQIDGFDIHMSGENPVVLVFHRDQPGAIYKTTRIVSEAGINISSMDVSRKGKGELALMVLATDSEIPQELITEIESLDSIFQVIALSGLNREPDLISDPKEEKGEYSYDPKTARYN